MQQPLTCDSLCIDFSLMNRITKVSAEDLLCVVESGVIREALVREHGADSIAAMRRVKDAFDPAGLFNPGKIFLD
jgi:FAD/FMN-containing dehydrogenase